MLDQTLAAADPAGIAIGTLTLHAGDCLKAVRLLDKSTVDTGKKMASDAAFGLAAQLLAAKLNMVAGRRQLPRCGERDQWRADAAAAFTSTASPTTSCPPRRNEGERARDDAGQLQQQPALLTALAEPACIWLVPPGRVRW